MRIIMMFMSELVSRTALLLTAFALAAGAYCIQHEAPRPLPPPTPTSAEILARIEQLGGKYELNQHGQVDHLNLKCLPISDDDLKILYGLPELKYLNLRGINHHGGDHFTDEGLRHVGSLKQLEHLNLTVNKLLTAKGSRHLTVCPRLKKLVSPYSFQGEEALRTLVKMPQLDYLWIGSTVLDERTLPYFQKMTLKLLYGVKVSDENIKLIAELPTLTRPPFSEERIVRDTDLKYFSHLNSQEELNIHLTNGWSDTSQLQHLTELKKLKSVSIYDYRYPARYTPNNGPLDLRGFDVLARLPQLKALRVPSEDRFLDAIAKCPHIERLSLSSNDGHTTVEGLEVLTTMTSLRELWVHEDLVCDESLEILSRVPSLEILTLQRDQSVYQNMSYGEIPERPESFTYTGVKYLTKLPKLKELHLSAWGVDNNMLGPIGQITTLEKLDLQHANITDQGLMQLRHLWNLKQLSMYGARHISMDVCWLLHPYMPECTIDDLWCCGCMEITPRNFMPWHLAGSGYID